MKGEPETLETALKELMRLVRKINALEKDINDKYGVRMIAGYIPGMIGDATGEVTVRRGIEEIEKALDHVRLNLKAKSLENSLGDLVVNGITDFADSAIMWRVSMPCSPNTNIGIERAIRREIKAVFDKEGIEIPFPQVVVSNAKK